MPAKPVAKQQIPLTLASDVLLDNTKVLAEARSLPTWQFIHWTANIANPGLAAGRYVTTLAA